MASKSSDSVPSGKVTKPYKDYPLTPHPKGYWSKKIRQRVHYFGRWGEVVHGVLTPLPNGGEWCKALDLYNQQAADLHAGRKPRVSTGDGLKLKDLLNRFLTSKQNAVATGELSPRTMRDYKDTCDRLVARLGSHRLVTDLAPDDFEKLRRDIGEGRGPVAIGNEVQRIRCVFRYGYEMELLDRPVRFGPAFKRPTKKTLRVNKQKLEKKEFSREEILKMCAAASPQLKAMILLGINAALGNADVGLLKYADIDGDWLIYPRVKTGIGRKCWLWPETLDALEAARQVRPTPKSESLSELVFITKQGKSWYKETPDGPIAKEARKLLDSIGISRKGVGFYALRHTFRTVADDTLDAVAIDLVMGHKDESMAAHYRERVADQRVKRVCEHVRNWLYGGSI